MNPSNLSLEIEPLNKVKIPGMGWVDSYCIREEKQDPEFFVQVNLFILISSFIIRNLLSEFSAR